MQEKSFERFLRSEVSSENSVMSRLAKARKAEEILGQSLDTIVLDDNKTYNALLKLKHLGDNDAHSPLQNAVRKYYKFINHKEFPRLREFD